MIVPLIRTVYFLRPKAENTAVTFKLVMKILFAEEIYRKSFLLVGTKYLTFSNFIDPLW